MDTEILQLRMCTQCLCDILLVNTEEGLLYLHVCTLKESLPLKTELPFASVENM
jgi:hypothetical protein